MKINKKYCPMINKEHDYIIVHNRIIKDYRQCKTCGHKEYFDYNINYNQFNYDLMRNNYHDFEEKAKKYDVFTDHLKETELENVLLLKEVLDLVSFVENDPVLEEVLIFNTTHIYNDLNMFLHVYIDLLNIKAEKKIKKFK